jgi:hypothetical protein
MHMRLKERQRDDDDICYHFVYIPSAYCTKKEELYIYIYIWIHCFIVSKMISQCIRGDGKKNSYSLSFILIFIENSLMNRS